MYPSSTQSARAEAQFKPGVLLYTGEQVVQFDEQLTAVPIGFLSCA